jgi:hypothetical protein
VHCYELRQDVDHRCPDRIGGTDGLRPGKLSVDDGGFGFGDALEVEFCFGDASRVPEQRTINVCPGEDSGEPLDLGRYGRFFEDAYGKAVRKSVATYSPSAGGCAWSAATPSVAAIGGDLPFGGHVPSAGC